MELSASGIVFSAEILDLQRLSRCRTARIFAVLPLFFGCFAQ
jgi:hypothetical protein